MAFFGARIVLSVVVLHYDGIDLQAVGKGFVDSRIDEELDTLERVAATTTDALRRLVSPDIMLRGREEE
jgi:hypothetical protein